MVEIPQAGLQNLSTADGMTWVIHVFMRVLASRSVLLNLRVAGIILRMNYMIWCLRYLMFLAVA